MDLVGLLLGSEGGFDREGAHDPQESGRVELPLLRIGEPFIDAFPRLDHRRGGVAGPNGPAGVVAEGIHRVGEGGHRSSGDGGAFYVGGAAFIGDFVGRLIAVGVSFGVDGGKARQVAVVVGFAHIGLIVGKLGGGDAFGDRLHFLRTLLPIIFPPQPFLDVADDDLAGDAGIGDGGGFQLDDVVEGLLADHRDGFRGQVGGGGDEVGDLIFDVPPQPGDGQLDVLRRVARGDGIGEGFGDAAIGVLLALQELDLDAVVVDFVSGFFDAGAARAFRGALEQGAGRNGPDAEDEGSAEREHEEFVFLLHGFVLFRRGSLLTHP